MHYTLRDGVSFCEIENRLFFLDIDADRYFTLSESAEASLRRAVSGDILDAATRCRLAGLVDRGVLRVEPSPIGMIASCTPPPPAAESLLDGDMPTAGLRATLGAVAAIAASRVRLRRAGLRHNLMAAVAGRRPDCNVADVRALRRVAAAFSRAGRLISAHDRCLAHSLALARSVSRDRTSVQVVLGIALGPFSAHCWVQSGAMLINDRVDRVSAYTPILVV